MKKSLLFITLVLSNLFINAQNYQWEQVGNEEITLNTTSAIMDFKMASYGYPVVMSGGLITTPMEVLEYNGTSWSYIDGIVTTSTAATDKVMALRPNNMPYISELDILHTVEGGDWIEITGVSEVDEWWALEVNDSDNLYALGRNDLSGDYFLFSYYAGVWEQLGSVLPNITMYFPQMAFDSNGNLIILSINDLDSGNFRSNALKFDGTNFENIGGEFIDPVNETYSGGHELAIGPNDEIYVSILRQPDNALMVYEYQDPNWVIIGDSLEVGPYWSRHDLAVTSLNEPIVVFGDDEANDHINCLKYEGGNWNLVGESGFAPPSTSLVLGLDENDVPYVGYCSYVDDFGVGIKRFVDADASIGNQSNAPELISLFPNPNNGVFTLENVNSENFQIYNSIGVLIEEGVFENKENSNDRKQHDFSYLPKGNYVIRLYTDPFYQSINFVIE